MNKQMNKTYALKISQELIKQSIESELTLSDFKRIADSTKYETSDSDMEAYLKSEIIYYLFQNMEYYKIEYYLTAFCTYIVRLASSSDGYNILAKMISASIRDMLVDVSRRVEIEVLSHLFDYFEMYYRSFLLFEESSKMTITENICNQARLSSLDIAENYRYDQDSLTPKEKEKISEVVSKTNYNRKKRIRDKLRDYIVNNFNEKHLDSFTNELNKIIENLNLEKIEKEVLIDKYKEQIMKLYEYAVLNWMESEEKDYQQLTLTSYLNN